MLWLWQTCDQDDDDVEIAVDNAAFMDDFFCQVSVATKNVGQLRMFCFLG